MRHARKCFLLVIACVCLTGCISNKEAVKTAALKKEEKIKIGMSFDSMVIERWQKDRDIFVSTAEEMGAEVNVQNANGDSKEQIDQIEYLIEKKMDVIVIIAVDSEELKPVVKKAKDEGIYVIAYDRLLADADADLYITFDNAQVGRLMAASLIESVGDDGRIAAIYGSPTDNNVKLVQESFEEEIAKTNIQILYRTYAEGWLAETGYLSMSEWLSKDRAIDGVLCGNDDVAREVIRALSVYRLAGRVAVVGQDADAAACQKVVEGIQTMTVYKPVSELAKKAAKYSVMLAKGETLDINDTFDDGTYQIPYCALEPIAVTKENMDDTVIADRFHSPDEVYLNVE